MEAIEIKNLFYFFLVLLIIPMTFILTKISLRYEAVRNFINKKSNQYSFQVNGYERQSYFVLHPNSICYLRILLIGASFFSYINNFFWEGIILFFLAAATDFVDGMVARSCELKTIWGKILDPLCDKLFYFPYFFYFAYKGFFSIHVVVLFLVWDLGVGQVITRKILTHYGFSPKSKKFGKIKTVVCIVCLTLCFAFDILQTQTVRYGVEISIIFFFYGSLVFSALSVFEKLKELLKKAWRTKILLG